MKKNIISLVLFAIVFYGCKKDSPSSSIAPPPIQSMPGLILPISSNFVLHEDDEVSINVKIINADGSVVSPLPNLAFNTLQSSIVSITGNTVKAKEKGFAKIAISDGIHATGYVYVNVVDDTTILPSGAFNIHFDTATVIVKAGNKRGLPPYIVTDCKGQTVNIEPEFFVSNAKATISGNQITAGSEKGFAQISARYNGKNLNGGLVLVVTKAFGTAADTIYAFTFNAPYRVAHYNQPSDPIILNIDQVIVPPCDPMQFCPFVTHNYYTSAPDLIECLNPDVMTVNSSGRLYSVAPGLALTKVHYKDAFGIFSTSCLVDFTGSWLIAAGGDKYNFCFERLDNGWFYTAGCTPDPNFSASFCAGGCYSLNADVYFKKLNAIILINGTDPDDINTKAIMGINAWTPFYTKTGGKLPEGLFNWQIGFENSRGGNARPFAFVLKDIGDRSKLKATYLYDGDNFSFDDPTGDNMVLGMGSCTDPNNNPNDNVFWELGGTKYAGFCDAFVVSGSPRKLSASGSNNAMLHLYINSVDTGYFYTDSISPNGRRGYLNVGGGGNYVYSGSFGYIFGGFNYYFGSSGYIHITKYDGKKISGEFNVSGPTKYTDRYSISGNGTVKGSFTDVPVEP
jgi:hypothetical protein